MRHWPRLAVAIAAGVALVLLIMAGYTAVVWNSLEPARRSELAPLLGASGDTLLLLLAMLAIALGLALAPLFRNYAVAALVLAQGTRLIATANPAHRLPAQGSAEMRELGAAINLLAAQYEKAMRDAQHGMAEARRDIEHEKTRLAALMGELSHAVVVCNLDGRVLLYNGAARTMFTDSAGALGENLLGLGRSVFALIDRHLIAHSLDRIREDLQRDMKRPTVHFVTTTPHAGLVRAQLAPVIAAGGAVEGYILTFTGTPGELAKAQARDAAFRSLTESARSALANIRVAAEALDDAARADPSQRAAFLRVIREEADGLTGRLADAGRQYEDAARAQWPLEPMLCADFLQAARQHLEQALGLEVSTGTSHDAWLRIDSYALLHALASLARRLREANGAHAVFLRAGPCGEYIGVDLGVRGIVDPQPGTSDWEVAPVADSGELARVSVRQIMERHGGVIWQKADEAGREVYFRLLLPPGEPPPHAGATGPTHESRPEFYDFDLFHRPAPAADEHRTLAELAYTVFDTETTGLEPSNGDEIIAIGAVRIVNGRVLTQEAFEQLIDPRRPVSAGSTRVTGIDATMLRGQPTIDVVLPRFHRYCEDTVLVAHNAAFDLRFLQLKEASTGIAFRQPVLDTLLLSAVLHPELESHRLEAIAERHGIDVIGRHTALGDAMLTADIFLRMIPQLAERGIVTLGDAQRASLKTYHARVRY